MKTAYFLALALATPAFATAANQSNYVFRFNTGVSSVFLSSSTFASEQPLNLGACTTNEKINGPLSCSVNCENQSVCLLNVSGPSGSSVSDVLEEVSEMPLPQSSPTPPATPAVQTSSFSSNLGTWTLVSNGVSAQQRRVDAYNSRH